MTWRADAAPIIRTVIARVGTADRTALHRALRAAYPFGPRKYFPYKVWLDEIQKQLGKKPRGRRTPASRELHEGQGELWHDE